jgi:hypothetical protein
VDAPSAEEQNLDWRRVFNNKPVDFLYIQFLAYDMEESDYSRYFSSVRNLLIADHKTLKSDKLDFINKCRVTLSGAGKKWFGSTYIDRALEVGQKMTKPGPILPTYTNEEWILLVPLVRFEFVISAVEQMIITSRDVLVGIKGKLGRLPVGDCPTGNYESSIPATYARPFMDFVFSTEAGMSDRQIQTFHNRVHQVTKKDPSNYTNNDKGFMYTHIDVMENICKYWYGKTFVFKSALMATRISTRGAEAILGVGNEHDDQLKVDKKDILFPFAAFCVAKKAIEKVE